MLADGKRAGFPVERWSDDAWPLSIAVVRFVIWVENSEVKRFRFLDDMPMIVVDRHLDPIDAPAEEIRRQVALCPT